MSNATDKAAIANIALLAVGEKMITTLTESTPHAVKINAIFEQVVKELLSADWHFNRKRVSVTDLTAVNKLTLDAAPTAAAFSVGATLTGATSLVTCTVLEKLSDTVYLVTEPSDDFTDDEVIGDGTNSRDCAAGYPDIDDDLALGSWTYGYRQPTDQLYSRGLGDASYDKIKYPFTKEGLIILTNQTEGYWHYNKWIGESGSTTTSDVTGMPIWFHRLISARLAVIISPNITENQKIRTKVEMEWREAYLYAREQNGDEAYSEYEQGNNDWADGAHRELMIEDY